MSQQDDKDASDKATRKIILGRITGVYGVKGWLKIFSYTDPMESIIDYSPWYIRPENSRPESRKPGSQNKTPWTRVKIKAGKRHAKTVVAKLENCNDRDEAQAYIGFEIAIEPDQLESLNDTDEFYWRDLIGLRVINQQDIELGVVTNMLETGANDVLVVKRKNPAEAGNMEGNKEHLIPWTMQQAIIAVDLEQGFIEVDWDPDF